MLNIMNKRGQFFLLAAVIVSAVIISLGIGSNKAIVNDEPESFYDFSYEVKREVGAVLDYEVYSGFDSSVNLTAFVDLLAEEIKERSPGSEFIFIFGNRTDMELKNYGSESVYADGEEIEGLNSAADSRICLEEICQSVDANIVDFKDPGAVTTPDTSRLNSGDILIEIEGSVFVFPLSDYRQVIFIMKKNIGGDRHIIVE